MECKLHKVFSRDRRNTTHLHLRVEAVVKIFYSVVKRDTDLRPSCRLRNLCLFKCPVRDIWLFACSLIRSFKQLELQSRPTIPYTPPAPFCLHPFPTWLPESWGSHCPTSPEEGRHPRLPTRWKPHRILRDSFLLRQKTRGRTTKLGVAPIRAGRAGLPAPNERPGPAAFLGESGSPGLPDLGGRGAQILWREATREVPT